MRYSNLLDAYSQRYESGKFCCNGLVACMVEMVEMNELCAHAGEGRKGEREKEGLGVKGCPAG